MKPSKPILLFVAGYAGSGKTMVGKIIASKLSAAYLDKDTMFRPIIEEALLLTTGNPHNYTSEFYNTHFKFREYLCMLNVGLENTKFNRTVVLTGPYTRSPGSASFEDPEWVARIEQGCKKVGARWHVIWVYSSNEKIKEMLIARKAPRDKWKLDHWEEYTDMYHMNQNDPSLPIPNHTVLRNDGRNLHAIEKDIDGVLADLNLATH